MRCDAYMGLPIRCGYRLSANPIAGLGCRIAPPMLAFNHVIEDAAG
jgi:hypothetical protein